jgi:hypothetical protein
MNDTRRIFGAGKGNTGFCYSLPALEEKGLGKISRLPVSIRIVLESVLVDLAAMRSALIHPSRWSGPNIEDCSVQCLNGCNRAAGLDFGAYAPFVRREVFDEKTG